MCLQRIREAAQRHVRAVRWNASCGTLGTRSYSCAQVSLATHLELARTGLSRAELQILSDSKSLTEASAQKLGPAQISRLIVAASEVRWHCDWLLDRLKFENIEQIGGVESSLLLLYALANLEYRNGNLVSIIADELAKSTHNLTTEQCIMALSSFAGLREKGALVERCATQLQSHARRRASLADVSPDSLANVAWACMRLACLDERAGRGLLMLVGSAAMPCVEAFELNSLTRLIGSLCVGGSLREAWQLYTKAQRTTLGSLSGIRGVLFHAFVRHQDVDRALTALAHLTIFSRVACSRTWRRALANVAVLDLLRFCGPAIALDGHRHLAPLAGDDAIMFGLGRQIGGLAKGNTSSSGHSTKALQILTKALRSTRNDSMIDQRKEFALLRHVLSSATAGDALSVLSAAEHFGNHISHLKFAGGAKRLLLDQVMSEAPEGLAVEFGTYLGYSAMRFGLHSSFKSVVTVEVDPTNAVVAKNIIEFAGLSSRVDVWIGNSGDLVSVIQNTFGADSVSFLFMDHRGSVFHEDLKAFEYHGLFKKGAKIVADNVLKPGAPRFLWDVHHHGSLNVDLVEVPEFGLGHACLEDWVAVCSYDPESSRSESPPPYPESIVKLAFDADAFRQRTLRGNVSIDEWATHAAASKKGLELAGISVTGYLTEDGRINAAVP